MDANKKSLVASTRDSLVTFFALYFTTLFSFDAWAAARSSPFRAPGDSNAFYRPAYRPAPDSYQAGMHGRGNAGPSGGSGGRRDVGRVPQARDSRAPVGMGVSAKCGMCMT